MTSHAELHAPDTTVGYGAVALCAYANVTMKTIYVSADAPLRLSAGGHHYEGVTAVYSQISRFSDRASVLLGPTPERKAEIQEILSFR